MPGCLGPETIPLTSGVERNKCMSRSKSRGADYIIQRLYYLWKSYEWLVWPSIFLCGSSRAKIDRPVFLLGVQGGGLTLLARMLRRHPDVVSATGNNRYWAGADEMQNVFGLVLPAQLTGIRYKPPHHPVLTPPRSWTYACNELLPLYRNIALDADPSMAESFRKTISYCVRKFGLDPECARFVDKSQVFTVKVSLVNRLLDGCDPKFVLVTRDPYVSCYRAAIGKAGDMARLQDVLSYQERLKLCAEHWANSYNSALTDARTDNIRMLVVKFEDLLREPEKILRDVCNFAELSYSDDMIPQQYHRLPFGSIYGDRWYPLRREVNMQYQNKIGPEEIGIIDRHCRELAEMFGYQSPSARSTSSMGDQTVVSS